MSRHPLIKWAQRSDKLFITVELPDAKNVKLNLEPEGKFFFSATSGANNVPYEIDIDLYDKVDVNESKASFMSRNICYLVKKAESKWWSRLLKQEGKPPVFIKVDWDKWIDEDEQDEKPGTDMDFGDIDFSVSSSSLRNLTWVEVRISMRMQLTSMKMMKVTPMRRARKRQRLLMTNLEQNLLVPNPSQKLEAIVVYVANVLELCVP
ncbi:Hypothetical predicted protein [Olea europaea subsp. europaea]|uniref:Co-chaperone protein p23 n=1 Tax=Olea europaea subsp. europaea TaxID=158383 RepID=A0A8S0VEB9_OLEEU|nr:Hypothetical predicted protein [Olea europaea subsp. europaea]